MLNTRKLLLNFIRPIWQNYEILKYFNVEEPVTQTALNDTEYAFNYMTTAIGKVLYSTIGLPDSVRCTVIASENSKKEITFDLPCESGLLLSIIFFTTSLLLLLLLNTIYRLWAFDF